MKKLLVLLPVLAGCEVDFRYTVTVGQDTVTVTNDFGRARARARRAMGDTLGARAIITIERTCCLPEGK